ncbi:MAG: PadR family transcriptional regulator [Pseudomonadota bacterium]
MNVRTLCLAILSQGDSTGYEIRKLVSDGHFSHFVDASFGSIYPALTKMEAEGLVVSKEERQDGKPNRKVYSICDAGRAAFVQALSEPAQKDIFKSQFLLLAMCAEMMEPADVRRAIDQQIIRLETELNQIEEEVQAVDLAGAEWVANYGRACLGQGLSYIKANRHQLEAVAGSGRQDGVSDPTISPSSPDGPAVPVEAA